jgi:hypothetical protein
MTCRPVRIGFPEVIMAAGRQPRPHCDDAPRSNLQARATNTKAQVSYCSTVQGGSQLEQSGSEAHPTGGAPGSVGRAVAELEPVTELEPVAELEPGELGAVDEPGADGVPKFTPGPVLPKLT